MGRRRKYPREVGDKVNYHSIIGEEITSTGHEVIAIERTPNNYGGDVAWITNKRGCVHTKALTMDWKAMKNE